MALLLLATYFMAACSSPPLTAQQTPALATPTLLPPGVITEFPLVTPASHPKEITASPDGNLWFTESDGNQIGRITSGRSR